MTLDSGITVGDVRTALQEIDADAIPDATIQQAIEYEELYVETRLPDGWEDDPEITDKHVDAIVLAEAKRRAFNTAGAEVRVQALDAVVSLDIQAFRGQLRRDVEKAWSMIGIYEDGDRAAFVDATSHAGNLDKHTGRWE